MGSSASTNVRAIEKEIPKENRANREPTIDVGISKRTTQEDPVQPLKNTSAPENDVDHQPKICDAKEAKTPQFHEDLQNQLREFEKKLAESESEKLDLQERIQGLEERLSEQVQLVSEGDGCQETLQAKDQYIRQLEQEVEAAALENKKLKLRQKKKVRLLMAQVTESKQEASIQLMELKDDLSRLTEENNNLKSSTAHPSELGETTPDAPVVSSHMSLILDLSQQVSEQEEKIKKLEEQLKSKNILLKSRKHSTDSITGGPKEYRDKQSDNVVKDRVVKSLHDQCGDVKSGSSTFAAVSDSPKLSRSPGLAPVEESPIEDNSRYLSRSRDSGFGSAGKTKTVSQNLLLTANTSKRINSASSMLSGLADDSDSDWGSDSASSAPLKSQSAPPGSRSPHLLPPSGRWENESDRTTSKKKKSLLKSKVDRNGEDYASGGLNSGPGLSGPTIAFMEKA